MKKHMKMILTMFVFAIVFSACSKDDEHIVVKYEVITSNSFDTFIEWTNAYGALNAGRLSNAGWLNDGNTYYTAITMERGDEIRLTGMSESINRKVEIKLYVDNQLVKSAVSDGSIKAEINMKL